MSLNYARVAICALGCISTFAFGGFSAPFCPNGDSASAIQEPQSINNPSGVTLAIAQEHVWPSVWINVPDEQSGQHAVLILLPEHVTVRRHGSDQVDHLYLWRPGKAGAGFKWTRTGNAFQWETEFDAGIRFLARVSLESDGVLYHYEFINRSQMDFDSVQAVTDPRMISPLFHDVRLERTYFHTPNGFVLLAPETPERLTMPLANWLPNRIAFHSDGPFRTIAPKNSQMGSHSLTLRFEPTFRSLSLRRSTTVGLWQRSRATPATSGLILSSPVNTLTRKSRSLTIAARFSRRRR
jgi:hypothetical protein